MSVLYRAVWACQPTEDSELLVQEALTLFSRWAAQDSAAGALPDGETDLGGRHVSVYQVQQDGMTGVEATCREVTASENGGHTEWTSVMRVVAGADGAWFWVDNIVETDDPIRRVKVGRPRIVDDLIRVSRTPMLGDDVIHVGVIEPTEADVSGLVANLTSPHRGLPLIVFAEPVDPDEGKWLTVANKTASRSAGIANVVALRLDAANAFTDALGALSVYEGSVRTYMPAPLDSPADGWRHRYIPAYQAKASTEDALTDQLVRQVANLSARRRPPDAFAVFAQARLERVASDSETNAWLLEEATALDERNQRLEQDLDAAREEHGLLQQSFLKAQVRLSRLQKALTKRGLLDVFFETGGELNEASGQSMPDVVQNVSDAVHWAKTCLADELVIPDSAKRDMDGIDDAPSAGAWGNSAWQGFQALAAYVRARQSGFNGDFRAWCLRGEALAWPLVRLSMTESESVQKRAKWMDARVFPISTEVEPSGRIKMRAHLKIAVGGPNNIPRVYFYDDTGGMTGKVHVGFVGPHYLVPNTKS